MIVAALLGCLAVASVNAADLAGDWSIGSRDRTYEVLTITPDGQQPAGWRIAVTTRPSGSYVTESGIVGHSAGASLQPRQRALKFLSADGSTSRFGYADPFPNERSEVLRLTPLGADHLVMTVEGWNFFLLFDRASAGATISPDWAAAGDEVPLVQNWPDNAEMAALFDADQADRKPVVGKTVDWPRISAADASRRVSAEALIDAGALHSGADYWHAAFIFQHGGTPASYLKAHALAVAAAARGYRDAAWIAAATLDRYLQSIGKPQVFGTQYSGLNTGITQEPYDRSAISDGLRAAVDVPPIKAQEQERQDMEARRKAEGPTGRP